MNTSAQEINFDGLVGPTHHYAGLSHGNLASEQHRHTLSNPRAAALEGLAKMHRLMTLGVPQAVLPPHERPNLALLRRLGFAGDDAAVLRAAQRDAPVLLAAASSASSMWAANAATVCPSADSADGRVHFTPANLLSELHRSIETPMTAVLLRRIFAEESCFAHHDPLPAAMTLRDEGAANHTRLVHEHGERGVQMFVYGAHALDPASPRPRRYPARQSCEASAAVARLHGLDPSRTLFVQQHPDAIDAGVFHNDVAAVGHQHLLLYHAQAFVDGPATIDKLRQCFERTCGMPLTTLAVGPEMLTLADAVESYLFNSQIVTTGDGSLVLVCPSECMDRPRVRAVLQWIVEQGPIDSVHDVAIRQSMHNGGGPACLRLRVVLTDEQRRQMHQGVMLTPTLHEQLVAWVHRHYREQLAVADLADPKLVAEGRAALDELTQLLDLGSIYPFQRG